MNAQASLGGAFRTLPSLLLAGLLASAGASCAAQTVGQAWRPWGPPATMPTELALLTAPAPAPAPAAPQAAHQLLVLLRMAPPHFRPDQDYGGRYAGDSGRAARRRLAEELARHHGLRLVDDWAMPVLGLDCYVYTYPAGADADALSALLARDPRVEWAQPMQQFQGLQAQASLAFAQPAVQYWRLTELHQRATGRKVTVAVIDSGVDTSHPDLAGQIGHAENFVDASPYAAEAHGTAVAGIIAARGGGAIVGVAPAAHLLALRACWENEGATALCNSFTLAKALHAAILRHARIINLSLAGPADRLLARLLDVALAQGATVVGAADPARPASFPASHPGVLAVARLEDAPVLSGATLLAPGRDIPAPAPGAHWIIVSGNSYATAHVTGMAALLAELQPQAGAGAIRRALIASGGANAGTIDACATIAHAAAACACSCTSKAPPP
ncbi:S8 family serine peptidase [Massilia sp. MB5]|uniref:S8 family peptidase n=1 Tax=Massilia sp. MB5 TaxID=2919578 RepID=UPI001F0FE629|nr:S8 family serine peptidase [Massilia sp. MB5]UMR29737.1 S8 family serine peptidase [Massilia sp. MB5]